MLNSAVVDVALALVYVFVLVSVLVSALNELFAGLLKQRAKSLWRGIAELVRSSNLRDDFYNHPLIKSLAPPMSGGMLASRSMTGPSYIPRETFAVTLLDILQQPHAKLKEVERALREMAPSLRAGGQPAAALVAKLRSLAAALPRSEAGDAVRADLAKLTGMLIANAPAAQVFELVEAIRASLPARLASTLEVEAAKYSQELATIIRTLAEETAGGIETFRAAIEGWFDAGMERVSGWYKRWTQLWQLGIGLLLAIALDINMVTIATALWNDIPLRTAIVGEAEKFAKAPPAGLWVVDPGKKEGEFDIEVKAPGLSTEKDRVVVRGMLAQPAKEDTTVTLKVADDVITLEKGRLFIPKGSREGEVAGTVRGGLPATATLDASYTVGEGDKKVTTSTKRTVKIDSDPGTRIERTRQLLNDTRLPIGWPKGVGAWEWSMLPGWLLTAIGASFGAPFWFDLLNRIVQLRAGGPKPEEPKKKAEEPKKKGSE